MKKYSISHTIHETTIIEKEYVDTHHVENFVENFAKIYYTWELDDNSIENRMEKLKGYLTDELQALNVDTVRKDIPVSSSVRGFQIWTVENLQFTQRKEELGIFKENEAKAILDAIHELKDEEDVIRKTFTDSGHVDWVSGTYFDFEIAKVTFE